MFWQTIQHVFGCLTLENQDELATDPLSRYRKHESIDQQRFYVKNGAEILFSENKT